MGEGRFVYPPGHQCVVDIVWRQQTELDQYLTHAHGLVIHQALGHPLDDPHVLAQSTEQEFGNLLISSRGRGANRLVYLKDVATIKRGYEDPPTTILRYDGKPAIGIGISTVLGGNVVTMAESINGHLDYLKAQTPLGMELHVISHQAEAVNIAINGFLVSLYRDRCPIA